MNARSKLNQAYVNGALMLAGVFAAIAESWRLFLLLTVILIGLCVHSGDIRLQSRGKNTDRGPRRR